jgi:hypothetical protein
MVFCLSASNDPHPRFDRCPGTYAEAVTASNQPEFSDDSSRMREAHRAAQFPYVGELVMTAGLVAVRVISGHASGHASRNTVLRHFFQTNPSPVVASDSKRCVLRGFSETGFEGIDAFTALCVRHQCSADESFRFDRDAKQVWKTLLHPRRSNAWRHALLSSAKTTRDLAISVREEAQLLF